MMRGNRPATACESLATATRPPTRASVHRNIIALVCLLTCFVLAWVGTAIAAPVSGFDVTYTSDADFATGTFKFIWVALSQCCT